MKKLVLETANIRHNAALIKEKAGSAAVIAVVKGAGYGMGIYNFATLLRECGADLVAVSSVDEARVLREGGYEDEILILSPTEIPEVAEEIADLSLTASIGSKESARALDDAAKKAGKRLFAHIALDTGMGRYGFFEENIGDAAEMLAGLENIEVQGVFSHLHSSFVRGKKFTQRQKESFDRMFEVLKDKFDLRYVHLANSCALFEYPKTRYTAVRVGSAFLGRLPAGIGKELKPCGYIECSLDMPKALPKGHNVGYAATYRAEKDIKIAVAQLGYADGFAVRKAADAYRISDRIRNLKDAIKFALSPARLCCTVGKTRCRILGRVGMTNCIVDITNVQDFTPGMIAKFSVNPIYVNQNVEREYR